MLCQVFCNTIFIILSVIFTVVIAASLENGSKANSSVLSTVKEKVCSNPSTYGFTFRRGTNKYYMIVDLLVTWLEGELICEKYGAHLAMPKNNDDNEFIKWFVGPLIVSQGQAWSNTKNSYPGIWLGGYYSVSTNTYKWINGEAITYSDWAPGEPNNGFDGLENAMGILYYLQEDRYIGWYDYSKSWDLIAVCELQC